MKKFNIYFDGSCRPFNPGGVMGIGGFITDDKGEWIYSFSDHFPENPNNTNNKAEAMACYHALCYLYDKFKDDLDNIVVNVFGDSAIICKKMNKRDTAFSGEYSEIAEKIHHLSKNSFKKVSFKWIPREENVIADSLSNETLCRNNPYLCD